MQTKSVYLKCERNVEVTSPDVFLKDIAAVWCSDSIIVSKLKSLKVHHFSPGEGKRLVISTLKLVELMEQECSDIQVQVVGETDVLLEWIDKKKHNRGKLCLKTIGVCLISFLGTAFTIMAYHNDIGIRQVFKDIYQIIMGREAQGITVLEVAYSIGLGGGIILFFNHFGGKRIVNEPTPLEVSIRQYEEDVDKAVITQAGREGIEDEP